MPDPSDDSGLIHFAEDYYDTIKSKSFLSGQNCRDINTINGINILSAHTDHSYYGYGIYTPLGEDIPDVFLLDSPTHQFFLYGTLNSEMTALPRIIFKDNLYQNVLDIKFNIENQTMEVTGDYSYEVGFYFLIN